MVSPLAFRSFAAGLCGLSRHEIPKQLHGISAKGLRNRNKFNDVDPAFATFIFRDK